MERWLVTWAPVPTHIDFPFLSIFPSLLSPALSALHYCHSIAVRFFPVRIIFATRTETTGQISQDEGLPSLSEFASLRTFLETLFQY